MEQPEETGIPPQAFVRLVKEALENLHDLPRLQRHPLAPRCELDASEAPALRLQSELMAAIETIRPRADSRPHTPRARLYNLLTLRYVEGLTAQEVAQTLGLSRRQVHRDLRRAEESVAALLWPRHATPASEGPAYSLEEEVAHLGTAHQPVDLRPLLERAQAAVAQLARRRGVRLEGEPQAQPVIVATNPVVAQQLLIHALSSAIQQAKPGLVSMRLLGRREGISLGIHYTTESTPPASTVLGSTVTELAKRLGWAIDYAADARGRCSLVLHLGARSPTLLVIDDNEGLARLLERYLTGHGCHLVATVAGREALSMAAELLPDAILLDVMMPEMDGWEVLQRLRTRPETASIPVIVCSVFNDPELALSLGASSFLSKPVRREEFLGALRRLGVLA
ncbi:MAG: response regulator [Anaerolineae bacterium]|nr:response regulator [Anaerolineae bacterium]